MGFQRYKGTPFEAGILPIIPLGAKLTEKSLIEPENIGKIPGVFYPHIGAWSGLAGWSKQQTNGGKAFHIWDSWYAKDQQIIGLQTSRFPAIDADVNEAWQADIVRDVCFRVFGQTVVRGRGAASPRQLMLYRLADGPPISKFRRLYAGPGVPEFAVEILGKGQQCLIEGAHPKGGSYEWVSGDGKTARSMLDLPEFGCERIPRIGPTDLVKFIAELDKEFALLGVVPQKPRQLRGGDTGSGPDATAIGPAHPQIAPSIAELTSLLGYITVNMRELEDYDAWEMCCRAIKTACGGDEAFYDEIFLPWMQENPDNAYATIRAKWESHIDSKVGYDWLCALAGPHGYIPSVSGLFEALDVEGDSTDAAVHDPQSPLGQSGGASAPPGGADSAPGVPGSAGPQGALPKADHERVIADRFVRREARKRWIYVPVSRTGGEWRQFVGGVWQVGNTPHWAIGHDCYAVSQMIRSTTASAAELSRAQYLSSAAAQNNVAALVKSHPGIVVRRNELDAHQWCMGVPGGYVDQYGTLQPPDPKLLITKRAGVAPDASVPCPQFEDLVFRLANYDFDTYYALRSAIGYTASGTGREQRFFFLHGHHAHEGKTTLLTLLGKVLGDYTHVLPNQALVAGKGSDNRFAFGGMEGVWFAYRGEVEENEEWATSALKDHTGSGIVSIEQKGKDSIAVPVRAGMWFQGNHLPRFRKPDPGLRRRMVIFECRIGVEGKDEAGWAERVFAEEGPGIMNWVLEARAWYQQHGLFMPRAMVEQKNEYLNTQDAYRGFIEQSIEFGGDLSVSSHEVYDAWRVWRDFEGLDSRFGGSLNVFIRTLLAHDLVEPHGVHIRKRGKRHARVQTLVGCQLGADNEDDEAENRED